MACSILVVDDDDDLRRVLRVVLEPVCRVLDCGDGAGALRLLEAEKPSLMLLDVSMPGQDGLEVLKEARLLHPELPVLMLTAEHDLAVARSALDHGARAFVTKPFDPEALRDDVCRLLGLIPPSEPYRPWRVVTEPDT